MKVVQMKVVQSVGPPWGRLDYQLSGVTPRMALKGRYEPVESLGDGGYGEVFKAICVGDQKTYAVKMSKIRTDEWAILRGLAHPAIVQCYESFESEGFMCIAMEYAEGGALSGHGILDEVTAKCVARDVAAGLAHMHALGIAHRDIKPDNVVFADTARRSVKIVDFGIATTVDDEGLIKGNAGSKDFKAPEVKRRGAYTVRADLWSLGVTMLYW
ncbi:kinase-like protein [Auricularia subglabra TFB-10046 SS5]|nr:kinase-like protein [Auricularia subglabra TFB-10046 SS5]